MKQKHEQYPAAINNGKKTPESKYLQDCGWIVRVSDAEEKSDMNVK